MFWKKSYYVEMNGDLFFYSLEITLIVCVRISSFLQKIESNFYVGCVFGFAQTISWIEPRLLKIFYLFVLI